MTARAHLSEEAEKEEDEDRSRLRTVQGRIRDLRERRQMVLAEVRRLSDEQKALHDARHPGEEEVERIHEEYRDLGRRLADGRDQREGARRRLDEALVAVREFRASLPRREHARPEEIRREMREIELRQQTTALPLAEENQLIDRLRRLTRELAEAERDRGVQEERHAKLNELETSLANRRAEVGRLSETLGRLKAEREGRMQSIRARLVDVGRIVGEIREKAKARAGAMDRLRAVGGQLDELEREADRLVRNSRGRRQEARRVVGEYTRTGRAAVDREAAVKQLADAQLEELLKRGRVVLRG